jgi:hypothetical protein
VRSEERPQLELPPLLATLPSLVVPDLPVTVEVPKTGHHAISFARRQPQLAYRLTSVRIFMT